MKKSEFKTTVLSGLGEIAANGYKLETIKEKSYFVKNYGGINAVFAYAASCEKFFEANLREDYERKTTFTSDLSIAEWCEQVEPGAVLDTARRCLLAWHEDKKYFAELILAVNLKSWEHVSRGNGEWSRLYADLYYLVKDLYFQWFEEDKDAIDYYFNYVD